MKKDLISAKEIARKHNLTYQTVNHYTNFGLINVVSKKGNVRLYAEEDTASRLAKITQLINAGLPLRVIRKALDEELSVKVLNNDTGAA
ncbi:MAG: MerR family transcriptional regulator [Candidatus Omnitrophota bacterium]|jgi:DNA-binding transcriptional MerR regulator